MGKTFTSGIWTASEKDPGWDGGAPTITGRTSDGAELVVVLTAYDRGVTLAIGPALEEPDPEMEPSWTLAKWNRFQVAAVVRGALNQAGMGDTDPLKCLDKLAEWLGWWKA